MICCVSLCYVFVNNKTRLPLKLWPISMSLSSALGNRQNFPLKRFSKNFNLSSRLDCCWYESNFVLQSDAQVEMTNTLVALRSLMSSHSPPLDALVVPSEDYHQVILSLYFSFILKCGWLYLFDCWIRTMLSLALSSFLWSFTDARDGWIGCRASMYLQETRGASSFLDSPEVLVSSFSPFVVLFVLMNWFDRVHVAWV